MTESIALYVVVFRVFAYLIVIFGLYKNWELMISWKKISAYATELSEKTRWLGVEIADRKQAEEAVRKSEMELNAIIQGSPIPQFVIDKDHRIIRWNKALEEYSGIRAADVIHTDQHWSAFYKEKRPCLADLLVGGAIEKIPVWYGGKYAKSKLVEGAYEATDFFPEMGESGKWLYFTASAIKDSEGNVIGAVETLEDITERKRAEEELFESRRKLAEIIDHLPDATLAIDADGKISIWNKAIEELTGVKAADVLGKGKYEYAPPVYGERRPFLIDLIFEPDQMIQEWHYRNITRVDHAIMAETTYARPQQKPAVVWCKATPFYDMGGKQIGAIESIRDITELRQAEEELRESEEKFRTLAESSAAAIVVYQGEWLVSVNPATERIMGYSKDELLKMRIIDIVHHDCKEMVLKRALARQRGEPVPSQYEVKILTKGGEVRWALLTAGRIMYRGKPAGLATLLDITERKRAEEALKDARARAELYLDLMSHDITNMNQALMGYLEMMEILLETGKIDRELVDSSIEIINRSSRLISDVKKLTQVQTGKVPLKDVDVCEMLADVKARYSTVPGRLVTINYAPLRDCMVRAGDPLRDVFENLVDNAIRHSTGPVTIDLSIERVILEGQGYYRITVADTGPGIPDDLKKKIFMTLKEIEKKLERRGLGLYLVKTLVDGYGGNVWVEDRVPGDHTKGARFVVMLPIIDS